VNAIALLRQEHDDVRALVARLRDAPGAERRLERVRELAALLLLHAQLEERFLYAAVEDAGSAEADRVVATARQQHVRIEDLIEGLVGADAPYVGTEPGVSELERTVLAHVREEEGRLFSLAEQLLGEVQLAALGRRMAEWRSSLDAAA